MVTADGREVGFVPGHHIFEVAVRGFEPQFLMGVAEDVSKPIIRPSGKVELEDGTDARLLASGRERTVTFRLYYFAKDRDRPKLENLAVRGAIGEAFLDGITVEDTYLGIDEGVSFTVTDGVLVASLELTLTEPVSEADAEPMEEFNLDLEVT